MRRFKVKPYSEPRKPQSPAQEKATQRAFLIFRLRGLWELSFILTGDRQERVKAAIDEELVRLGAEPQTARREANRRAFEAELASRDPADDFADVELPF